MQRGRKPSTDADKKRRGQKRPSRLATVTEFPPLATLPDPPPIIAKRKSVAGEHYALDEWHRLTRILKNKGVLPEGDETALKQINAINDAFNKIRNG